MIDDVIYHAASFYGVMLRRQPMRRIKLLYSVLPSSRCSVEPKPVRVDADGNTLRMPAKRALRIDHAAANAAAPRPSNCDATYRAMRADLPFRAPTVRISTENIGTISINTASASLACWWRYGTFTDRANDGGVHRRHEITAYDRVEEVACRNRRRDVNLRNGHRKYLSNDMREGARSLVGTKVPNWFSSIF